MSYLVGNRADLAEGVSLIVTVLGGLIFLFPLAIYLLYLAILNARHRPTLVSGTWDFVGVLFAISGFLLVGGPWVMAGLYNRWWEEVLLAGEVRGNAADLPRPALVWWLLQVGYLFSVLGCGAVVLWMRSGVTVIYNCSLPLILDALAEVRKRLSLEASSFGNRLLLRAAPAGTAPRLAEIEVEQFRAMRHITLRWRNADDGLRHAIETELGNLLAQVEVSSNPVSAWLLTLSSCFFGAILFGLGLLVYLQARLS